MIVHTGDPPNCTDNSTRDSTLIRGARPAAHLPASNPVSMPAEMRRTCRCAGFGAWSSVRPDRCCAWNGTGRFGRAGLWTVLVGRLLAVRGAGWVWSLDDGGGCGGGG